MASSAGRCPDERERVEGLPPAVNEPTFHESDHRTLPDGSSRELACRAAPVGGRGIDLARSRESALAARGSTGTLVDLSYPLERMPAVRIVTDRSPEALHLTRIAPRISWPRP